VATVAAEQRQIVKPRTASRQARPRRDARAGAHRARVHRGALARADDRPFPHLADEAGGDRHDRLVEGPLPAAPVAWTNYSNLFHNTSIPATLRITAEIAIGGTILPILVAASAAYAFAWMDFPGRDWLFVLVIALLVVPLQMALIPIFTLYNKLHLFDTVFGLILFHTAFALPFAIFLLRNFFIGIPEGHPRVGADRRRLELRIFLRLILPLGLPAIASLAIFQFLWTWNDLLVALTLARSTQPTTVAIFSQLRQFGRTSTDRARLVPVADRPARGLLRLPALLRGRPPGRLGQVGVIHSVPRRPDRRREQHSAWLQRLRSSASSVESMRSGMGTPCVLDLLVFRTAEHRS
jgi:ABC-type glycerol-3-phosphate transport system permease component